MKPEYTTQELSGLLNVRRRAAGKLAAAGGWTYREATKANNGSPTKYYLTASIDPETLARIAAAEVAGQMPQAADDNTLPVPAGSNLPALRPEYPVASLTERQLARAAAKSDLLIHYNRALKSAGYGDKAVARDSFVAAYNTGLAYPELYAALGGELSWKTIEGWKRIVRGGGDLSELADRRGRWRRGRSIVTAQQAVIMTQCALHPNAWLPAEVIREAKKRMAACGIANGHSAATYYRWLSDFRSHNDGIWCWSRGGKKRWNDECCISIDRDPDLIEVGDVLVADGHKLNFDILNPWTGKAQRMILICWYDMRSNFPCGWEISPTEDTVAISAALRRAILTLGKIPRVAYLDNGRAFKSKYFTGEDGEVEDCGCFKDTDFSQAGLAGTYAQLGMQVTFAWAYHGQSKTVERFFGTAAELERKCPTYVGTSIDKKPPRLNRGEKLHRRVYDAVMAGKYITMEMAHRAVAAWFDEYAKRPQEKSKYLRGYAPADLFLPGRGPGVDPLELTYLMWAQADVMIRASRIQFRGRNYYHPALYDRRHRAEIKYDLQDPGYIVVFEKGELICIAPEQDQVHPMARLGTDEDKALLSKWCEIKRHQEKQASDLARQILEAEVLPAHQRQLAYDGITPTGPASAEVKPRRLLTGPVLTPEQQAESDRIRAAVARQADEDRADERREAARIEREIQEMQAETGSSAGCEDAEPPMASELEPIPENGPEMWQAIERMPEEQRYKKLSELEARDILIPQQWRAFMSYYELTPEYERKRDYYVERRAQIRIQAAM